MDDNVIAEAVERQFLKELLALITKLHELHESENNEEGKVRA